MELEELLAQAERAFEKGEWLQSIAASSLVLAKQAIPLTLCGEEREWAEGSLWPCVLEKNHAGQHKDAEGDQWT